MTVEELSQYFRTRFCRQTLAALLEKFVPPDAASLPFRWQP